MESKAKVEGLGLDKSRGLSFAEPEWDGVGVGGAGWRERAGEREHHNLPPTLSAQRAEALNHCSW